jgi:small GTP-binding protein
VSTHIWDTSGSERYRSIVTGHYRAAVGALLVFDVTDRETYECLDHWLKELRENCDEHCTIALVANKIDLINKDPNLRAVSINEIKTFADYNDLMFIGETSAKEDINIKETFESLLQKVHSK